MLRASAPAFLLFFAGLYGACTGGEPTDIADVTSPTIPPQTDPGGDPFDPGVGQDPSSPGARAVSASLINITWKPNTETDLAGYKVYRNEKAIKVVDKKTTTYADRDVLPATTYTYALTAFDIAGNESVASPTFRATTHPTSMPPLSFASDVFPMLQSQCSNCHAAFATLDTAFTRLTSMGSGPCAGRRLMVPGNALRSLLFQKITGSHDCGDLPPSAPLPSAQANVIGAWINQGGINN